MTCCLLNKTYREVCSNKNVPKLQDFGTFLFIQGGLTELWQADRFENVIGVVHLVLEKWLVGILILLIQAWLDREAPK